MTTAFLARRNLSVGDISVIEVSDNSDVQPHLAPIGPSVLDLTYISVFANKVVDSQQVNREGEQKIDRKPYLTEEARMNLNKGPKDQTNPNPHAWLISSLQIDLKEAQVVQTIAMEEITGLKTELIS